MIFIMVGRSDKGFKRIKIKMSIISTAKDSWQKTTKINDMPPSREWSKAMSHQSLDEDIVEAIDEMTDRWATPKID